MKHDITGLFAPWKTPSVPTRMGKSKPGTRERRRSRLHVEVLESRLVLSAINWSTAAAPTGGDWNVAANWVGGVVPGAGDTAIITGLTGAGTVYLQSGGANSVAGLTTDSTTTLEVITGSLSFGVAAQVTLGGQVIVEPGAALNVGAGATVTLAPSQPLTDDGTLSFADGDNVSFPVSSNLTTQIVVDGMLSAVGTKFVSSGSSNGSVTQIYVAPGGELVATTSAFSLSQLELTGGSVVNPGDLTGDTFNLPLYVSAIDVPLLASNQSFQTIDILGGTLLGGQTTSLNLIGNSTAGLSYVFPSGFTVAAGATMNFGAGVPVVISASQTFSDNGIVDFGSGDTVTLDGACCGSTQQIAVAGTLTATDTTFNTNGTGTSNFAVSAAGQLEASNSTFNLPIYVPYVDVPFLANNASFQQVDIDAGTLLSGTLDLNLIGTNTSNLSYAFPGGFTVAPGATMAVGPNVPVFIEASQNFADNGTVSFASGDTVTLDGACCSSTEQIAVAGTLSASDTTFNTNGTGTSIFAISAGGQLLASNSTFNLNQLTFDDSSVLNSGDLTGDTFNLPIYVPYGDVPFLANNASFQQVDLNAGTLKTGTLDLNLIGNNTSNLSYAFPGGFTVALGATMAVGPNVPVFIPASQNFADDGTVSFASGDTVTLDGACCSSTQQIAVAGTLTATDTTFNDNGTGTSNLSINSGGQLLASTSTFNLSALSLASGSSATMSADVLYGQFAINSNTNISISGMDFSNLGNDSVIVTGDSLAQINLSGNYWGTTVAAQIAAKILDHNEDGTRPTVVYTPFVTVGASGLVASSATATFSPTEQTVDLSATVTDSAGDTISEGTVTFTILNGTQVIGLPTNPIPVSSNTASTGYNLPGNTPAGQYTILASFSGSSNYLPSTDRLHTLAINAAATTTSPLDASAPFSASSNQSVTLTANLGPATSTINAGTVTFTVEIGGNPVGRAVSGNVSGNTASASYTLLAGTVGGTYTIVAVYSDPVDFSTSTGTSQLVVSAASTSVASASATATFSEINGEGFALSANVSSPAGTVSEGSVLFTVLNESGTQIAGPFVTSVFGGTAAANAFLPAGTPVGSYTIVAVYSGTANFAMSLPETSSLTVVAPEATSTMATAASAPFNSGSQTIPLSATVTSTAGVVNEGTVTFTVLNGSTPVGTPVTANVTSGAASAIYALPGGTPLGTYTIQAAYNDTGSFLVSVDLSHLLTVTQPAPAQLVIFKQPSPSSTAGQVFAVQPVVYEEDLFGNLDTADNTTVVTVSLASGAGVLEGTLSAVVSGGVATFTTLSENTAGVISLEFSSGNLTPASSAKILVGAAAGVRLVVLQQPSATATAGVPFATQPIVAEEDPYGNVVTSDNSDTVTASRGTIGTAALQGTSLTVTLSQGEASFTGLAYDTAETMNLSFTTTATGVSSATSIPVVVSPAAADQFVIDQQPSSAATAGQPFAVQPISYEVDQFGNLEIGDSNTVVTASVDTGSGLLQGSTAVTLVGGIATFTDLADDSAGLLTLDFSGAGLSGGPSSPINISPGPASQLVIATPPYSSVYAGSLLTDPVVVDEDDQFGNIVTSDNSTVVTASQYSGAGMLTGTTTATVSNGVASFNDLENDTAGMLTIEFTAGTLTPAISSPTVVLPDPATRVVVTRPPGGVVSGSIFTVTVAAEDPYDNTATSYNGPVTVALASGSGGTLSGTTTMMATDGVADFNNLVETKSGPIALDATSGSLTSGSSGPVNVTPGVAARLIVQIQPSQTATAGDAFQTQPVVYEEDAFGNILTGDSSTAITAYIGSGVGPLGGTVSATVKAGVATFSGLSALAAGTITLQFTGAGLTSIPTVPVVISPAAASKLVIRTQPSPGATAGQAFLTQPVIAEEDAYGNLETDDSSTQVIASVATGAGPLQGTAYATLSGGIATFANLADDIAGTITLKFASDGVASSPTSSIAVSPTAATKLQIAVPQPASVQAGTGFGLVVDAVDPFGNIDPSFNGTVNVALAANPDGETLGGTGSVKATAGVASFAGLTLDVADASYSLIASTTGLPSVTTATTQVAPQTIISVTPTAAAAITTEKIKNTTTTVITIQYSTAMDPTSTGAPQNYVLSATAIKVKKKKKTPVSTRLSPTVTFVQSTNTITLTIKGKKNAFPTGGLLTIVASPSGVHSQAGVFLSAGSVSFTISKNANHIT